MPLSPIRLNIASPLSPGRELALARQLLEIQSEAELDRFLPLLAAAVPMLTNIAGPLIKNLAGSLFGGGSGKKKRPRDQQEQFLGGIVKGLLGGEMEHERHDQEQFLGGIFKGLLGGEMEAEQEQFLGGIIGKLFGGRELEAENYVQEQFLGGIVKGLLGGEMETEAEGETPPSAGNSGDHQAGLIRRARRFVRLVNTAATHAAAQLTNLQRAGRQPTTAEARRIVLAAIIHAARRFVPRLAAVAFSGGERTWQSQPMSAPQAPQEGQTMLELMIADAVPLGSPASQGRPPSNGHSLR